jgi:hypothetical protein
MLKNEVAKYKQTWMKMLIYDFFFFFNDNGPAGYITVKLDSKTLTASRSRAGNPRIYNHKCICTNLTILYGLAMEISYIYITSTVCCFPTITNIISQD